jgi:hypothetical protein
MSSTKIEKLNEQMKHTNECVIRTLTGLRLHRKAMLSQRLVSF